MGLSDYHRKRKFDKTPEPRGRLKKKKKELRFVVQQHHASHMHYDFRLEMEGVLKSWAVPKGPSMNPLDKRLAMMVEDHPYEYRTFEGSIPQGNYGAGDVIIWDEGTYEPAGESRDPEKALLEGLAKGDLKVRLHGHKLNGEFVLAKMKKEEKAWLLIKHKDAYATRIDVLLQNKSVVSGRTVDGETAELKIDHPKSKIPTDIKPMLAATVDKPFDHKEWIFEIKRDGYRAIAQVEKNNVRLYSRNGQDFNKDYPEIIRSLEKLGHTVVLDGEIVVLDDKGRSQFQLLQQYSSHNKHPLIYYVFDILYLDGYDIRDQPLIERKKLLRDLLKDNHHLIYSDHIEEGGVHFFKAVKQKGIEGMIAKKRDSRYVSARSNEWLKVKNIQEAEVIICGFTAPRGTREKFGALLLGVYKGKKLVYVGHTGSGFSNEQLHDLHELLDPLEVKESPFENPPKPNAPVTWVKPKIVCQVKYGEMTQDGIMRHAIYIGLRTDKTAKEVAPDKEVDEPTPVSISNPEKLYWPEDKITKRTMVEYYERMGPYILPHMENRLQSLNRFPNGIHGKSFYQKNISDPPDWLQTVPLEHSDGKVTHYLLCRNKDDLLYMANAGCIEMNPWNSRYTKIEYPDYLIMDIDPNNVSFGHTVKTTKKLKEILDAAQIDSFIKTSGKRGLHVMIPLGAKYTYDQTRQFAEILAKIVYGHLPEVTSVVRDPKKRQKKIYIDFLQNRIGQTISAPYSLRPLKGAPVSTPLYWKELDSLKSSTQFTIKSVFSRVEKYGDIWEDFVTHKGIDMLKALDSLW